jgi:hypothetical protein
MHALGHDLVLAWRRLRATPAFTAFSVVTLGLGIGATTAIYSVVRVMTGPPAGVRDVGTIMNIYQVPGGGSIPMIALSWPDYQDLKARQTVFESLTAWAFFRQAFAANGRAETAWGEVVGGEYFQTLKVQPYLGRALQPADDRPDAPPVAMISYRAWQRVFDSASDVVDRQIQMNGHSFQIVGVAPKEFRGLFNNGLVMTAMWVPLGHATGGRWLQCGSNQPRTTMASRQGAIEAGPERGGCTRRSDRHRQPARHRVSDGTDARAEVSESMELRSPMDGRADGGRHGQRGR